MMTSHLPLHFRARVIRGSGRGKGLGVPTINLDLRDVPSALQEGIYAARATIDGQPGSIPAAMHYGPRPVFRDAASCELHLLNLLIDEVPAALDVDAVEYIRDVQDFPSPEAMMKEIENDISRIRAVLGL